MRDTSTREIRPRVAAGATAAQAATSAGRQPSAFRELLASQPAAQMANATTSTSGSQPSGLAGLVSGSSAPAAAAGNTAPSGGSRVSTPWTPTNSTGPHDIPTAGALFGAHPWLENPTGYAPNGQTWSYNPRYFATRQTAETVAAMVGGTVVEQNQFCTVGPLAQAQPNEMVKLANGRMINAGEFVGFFTHGYPQYYVDRLIAQELQGEVG
jgi:hypothetical protein